MVFWKRELRELEASGHRFEDIFRIFSTEFTDTPFSLQFTAGQTQRMSYAELTALTNRLARVLHAHFDGQEGAFLAIRMENSPLWVAAFFGTLMAGFRPLLLNLRLDDATLAPVERLAAGVLTDRPRESCVNLAEAGDAPEFTPVWADEIALMTSGTTGTPKLVLYDGAAITAQLLQSESIVRKCPEVKHDRLARQLRMLAFLPFYHIFGLMASLLWFIFFGVTFVFLERYDSRSIQYACKVGRVTHFFAVPAVWEQTSRQLLREAERQGQKEKLLRAVRFSNGLQSVFPRLGARLARRVLFRRVREQALGTEPMFCISGGGFLQPQAAELMNGLGYGMHNGYGMTETGILSVELSRRAKWRLSGGVGQPLQALSGGWRIAEDGVLELRSPLLYTAMLENGVRVPRDPEAWFRTRDVFRAEGGRWYMEARQGDLIIGANGENLSPDLIEQRLALQAGTASCVLGMEREGDERPVLIVQTAADDYARARASAAAYEAVARLPLTMRPARIFLTEQELPISFGKPRRAELREKLADGSIVLTPAHRPEPEELTRLEDESSRALVQELCELLGSVTGQTVGPDTQLLQELGVDSLTYYNIFSAVSERYGISLTMDAAHPLFTARDFAAAVQAEREAVE